MLHRFISKQQLGEVWFAPVDVIIQKEPLRTRQPDLLFVSNEHASILGDQVDGVSPARFTIKTAFRQLEKRGDTMRAVLDEAVDVERLLGALQDRLARSMAS